MGDLCGEVFRFPLGAGNKTNQSLGALRIDGNEPASVLRIIPT